MKKLFYIFCGIVLLFSNTYSQVLLEITRNFDCAPCKLIDPPFEAYLAQHPEYNSTVIFYHNNTPYPSDPFYLAAKDEVNYRTLTFYTPPGGNSNPALYVNGNFVSQNATQLDLWKSYTKETYEFMRDNPHPSIELSQQSNGDGTYTITIDITGTSGEVRPFIVITESGIVKANTLQYGVPESGVWDNIFRKMLPAPEGGDAFTLQGSKTLTFTFDPRGKDWDIANLSAIAFLQSTTAGPNNSHDMKAIKSSGVGFFELGAVKTSDVLKTSQAFPNPFTESIQVPFTLSKPAHVTIRISDLLGREIATVIDEKVSELQSSVTFAPRSLVSGTYVASIFVDGVLAGTQKLIYNP
jgi:hypothetical protein